MSVYTHPAHGSGFSAWFRTLSQNGFAVDFAFIPKVLFITITIVLAGPFRCYEWLRYNKRVRKVKVLPPVFILGHPRSGTTFLHYLMSKDPAFGYCTTVQAMVPHLFLSGTKIFSAILSRALPGNRPMDNLKMGSELPKEEEFAMALSGSESLVAGYYFPRRFLKNLKRYVCFEGGKSSDEQNWKFNYDYFLRKLSYVNPGKNLLMKSPGNTGRIKQLLELYPEARFVHISRNPFDVYQSNVHLYKKILPLFSFQHVKQEEVEAFVLEGYKVLLKKYLKDKELIPPNKLVEIRYEEFVADPLTEMEKLYAKLGLGEFSKAKEYIAGELNDYKNYERNKFELSVIDKEKVSSHWKFAFDAFAYSVEIKL